MIKTGKFILLFILLIYNYVFAQNPIVKFERITSEILKIDKGLSQNSVSSIVLDNDGFLWIGTWDGLNRYDGYNFAIYKPDYFNPKSGLSSASIRALFVDKKGLLWIGTEFGLNTYNTKTRIFNQFLHNSKNINSLSNNYVNAITEDKSGNIWVGTKDGLNKINPYNGKIKRYHLDPDNANSLSNDFVNSLLVDDVDNLWIATQKGLNRLNISNDVFSVYYANKLDKNSISSDFINCIYIDKNKDLWIGTDNGLNYYKKSDNSFVNYKNITEKDNLLTSYNVNSIMMDKNNSLYIGTLGYGLIIMNLNDKKTISYRNTNFDNSSLSNDYINCLLEDKSGNIWVGTSWEGLNKIDKQSKKFRHYTNLTKDEKSISNNLIWSIVSDKKGNIWIATNEGVNIYNKKSGTYSRITHTEGVENSLGSNKVRMIVIDHKRPDIVWFAMLDAGVDKYNVKTKEFTHYRYNPKTAKGLSTDRIVSLYEDKLGEIWIGTEFGGLNILNPENGNIAIYRYDPNNPFSISSDIIYPIYEDRNGIVWVGTYKGLNKFDRSTKRFYRYLHNPDDKSSLSSDMIFSIYQDKKAYYWIGTMGGGLNKFNPVTKQAIYYTEVNGLPNDVVYSSIEDKNGDFWLSTNFGISKFNPEKETFVNFDVKDGVQSHEFNYGASLIDEEGQLYFGGMNGYNAFFPNEIKMNNYIPPVVITSFKIFNIEIPLTLSDGDTIKLTYDKNFFSLDFSSLDFSNSYKNKYAYYLENYDKTWVYTNASKRYADYTGVKPGKYIFNVKGSNNDGIWNEKGIKIYIEISPPWYDTWFFKSFVIGFAVFVIWLLLYLRIKSIRKKHEIERKVLKIQKEVFELEQKSLRLQMNPHFMFNSLNSIQSFVIEKDTDKAIYYLSKFSQLMRLVLHNSQQTFVVLKDEIKVIKNYLDLERLRYNDSFEYIVDIEEDIDDDFIGIPPMIIQPYLENAIIHGIIHKKDSIGKLQIQIKLIGNYLFCTIVDNGIGRKESAEIKEKSGIKHKSSGMLITQERLNILNNNESQVSVKIIDLIEENGNASGTRVELMILYKEL